MKKICPICLWSSAFPNEKCHYCGFSIAGEIKLKAPISLTCPDGKHRTFSPDLFGIQGGTFSKMEHYCRNVCHFACGKYPLQVNHLLNNSSNMAKLKRYNQSLDSDTKSSGD